MFKNYRDAGMTESFGDGYSTRSNEEGFGGIYGGNEEEEEGGDKAHGISPGIHLSIYIYSLYSTIFCAQMKFV